MRPVLAATVLLVGLVSCTPITPDIPGLLPDIGPGIMPFCGDAESLGTVSLVSPEYYETIGRGLGTGSGFVHSFQWAYEGDCWPSDGFRLMLSENPDRLDTLPGVLAPSPGTRLEQPYGLEYGREYFWTVAPIQDGEPAPPAPGFGAYAGATPHRFRFFTGPICDVTASPAPELISPENGEIVASLFPVMAYAYPGRGTCVADRFSIDLSTDSGFATGSPWSEIPPATSTWPAEPLLDCTRYYWRVRALGEAGRAGPYSDTWSYYTSVGALCPPPEPPVSFDPTPFTILTSVLPPLARPVMPIDCRFGPAPGYHLVRYLGPEDLVTMVGRDFDASWLQVQLEGEPLCWALADQLKPETPDFDPMTLLLGSWGPSPTKPPEGGGEETPGCIRNGVCTAPACGPNDPNGIPCTL